MIRMPQWMKDKWVAALRSGEYEQGHHRLKTGYGYCCLGVLQHSLYGDVERHKNGASRPTPSPKWCTDNGVEFEQRTSPWVPSNLNISLVILNDRGEATFDQIADIIEKGVEGY